MPKRMLVALCMFGLGACGAKNNPEPGSIVSTGGAAGSGGAHASGGSGSASGGSRRGGSPATGGGVSTGGATGGAAGGTTGLGGSPGSGGTTSSGGSTPSGGNPGTGGGVETGGAGGQSDPLDAGPPAMDGGEGGDAGKGGDAGALVADSGPADIISIDVQTTAPPTCPAGLATPTAGNQKRTLQHGGRSRGYTLHVPPGLPAGKPLAAVFDFHGAGGDGSQQQGMSGWAALGDKEGFLTVFPNGVDGYWNVDDTCCGTAGKSRIDDVGFVKAIIEKLGAEVCLDAKRLYASGFSNGGGFTHRLGCDAADVIAGIAPMSTDLRTQPCKPARPITMIEIRGMADSLEPYEGGLVGPAGGQYVLVGAKQSLKLWAELNQCTDSPTAGATYCEGHTQCGDGVETQLCSLPNVDHSPYNNSLGFNVAAAAWKVFQRHPMR